MTILPSLTITDGGEFPSPTDSNIRVAQYSIGSSPFDFGRLDSLYFCTTPVGDVFQFTSDGMSSGGSFQLDIHCGRQFFVVERLADGSELQRKGPFESDNAYTYDSLL